MISAGLVVVGSEQATENRDDSEHGKRASGDPLRRDVLGLPVARQGCCRAGHRCDFGEASSLAAEFRVVRGGGRDAAQRIARQRLLYDHQPVRIWIGQRMQQHRINRRKNRRVCANRQRQRQDRNEAEAGAFQKLTKRELKILQHGLPP